jgi:hypothetical protein
MTKNLAMLTALSLAASACGGAYDEGSDEVLDEDAIAESEQALTNVNHCVTDSSTPNAVSHISSWGSSESYTRLWQYIDTICPESRDTTSVQFNVMDGITYEYRFVVTPAWWTPTNPVDCANLTMASRVQRHASSGAWETIKYEEESGVWNWYTAKCIKPQFQFERINSGETEAYRVRAWALQWDGVSHASVTILGANSGPP